MIITEKRMDLFKCDEKYALAHCISLDCEMGKGIAKQFNRAFPKMKGTVVSTISYNNLTHPTTIAFITDGRTLFNLITKENYYDKPTLTNLTEAIKQMYSICKGMEIKHLAMPRIGCGLDGHDWDTVKGIIEYTFMDLDIDILVCNR